MAKRVLLVDDHAIFTQAMRLVIGKVDGLKVVGTAGTLAEGRTMLFGEDATDVDLVVMDLMLPDGNGAALISEIKATMPTLPVVVLSADAHFDTALEAGADDAINKSTPLPEIVMALQRIAD